MKKIDSKSGGSFMLFAAAIIAVVVLVACGSGGSGGSPTASTPPAGTPGGTTGGNLPGVIGQCSSAGSSPNYVMVYKSSQSIVCVDSAMWAQPATAAAIPGYFPYFDAVILQDKALFPVQTPNTPFVFQITAPTGGASTGCSSFPLLNNNPGYCNTVTGDAFTNTYNDPITKAPIPGFWGYLLSLHESINVFTGLTSGGWPTDWWADHRSPFPNTMDAQFMASIANNNSALSAAVKTTLLNSSTAQLARFTNPISPTNEYDTEVALFNNIFNGGVFTGTNNSGFSGYNNMMALVNADGLTWTTVSQDKNQRGDDNYSENLSEYVIAYLHLGFGSTTNSTTAFANAGVGLKDSIITNYTISAANVQAIANAHCSIRAASASGVHVSTQLAALQNGNFQQAMASGGTAASCPGECAYTNNACVAKF
jgi:hypothetical protein